MPEMTNRKLEGVPETLLITLYVRAMESQRSDAIVRDECAVALVRALDYDFARIKQIRMDEDDKTAIVLRSREIDRHALDFLARHPQATIVHIGCGLDSRFERVDNGQVEWFDLDMPDVIELRRRLIGDDSARYHLLGSSAFETGWMKSLCPERPRPFLFLAEGVFMYFTEAQVRSLVLALKEQFAGAELVFDVLAPYMVTMNNLRFSLTKFGARYHWGLADGRELEKWEDGIRLLDVWYPFDTPDPRLDHVRWMRRIPFLAHVIGIYHYRLGQAGALSQ